MLLEKVKQCRYLIAAIISISVVFTTTSAFNLENRLPLTKYGARGSYFGYSVAEHVEEAESGLIRW